MPTASSPSCRHTPIAMEYWLIRLTIDDVTGCHLCLVISSSSRRDKFQQLILLAEQSELATETE